MEKVQFQLEATLPELQDLHEKGLFTKLEINQITRRRTALETSLIRQKTRKEDYFSYAEYEINLERLRKVRWKRLGYEENPPPPSTSTYSIPRRVLYILKRATVKFPGDLAVWLAYVEFAAREGMRKVVLKGLTSALQHHPQSPTIYLLLSYHHLHPTDPFPREATPSSSTLNLPATSTSPSSFSLEGTSSARTTFLLGLRACEQSTNLWTEYIKLELGWVEALRRRWSALGLEAESKGKSKEVEFSLDGGEGSFGPEGEDARKAILSGQLVVQALNSALETIKPDSRGLEYREELVKMLRIYPSPLRRTALDVLYEEAGQLSHSQSEVAARARMMVMTRTLHERPYVPGQKEEVGFAMDGVNLIDELGRIGKEIRKETKLRDSRWGDAAGRWLGDICADEAIDLDIRKYLFSVFSSLTTAKTKPTIKLLLLHLDIAPTFLSDEEYRKVLKLHATLHPTNASLQRRYLESLLQSSSTEILATCEAAAKAVTISKEPDVKEDILLIWNLWADALVESDASEGEWQKILKLSQKLGGSSHLFPILLARYFSALLNSSADPLPKLADISSRYGPSAPFYASVFDILSAKLPFEDLAKVYEMWNRACKTTQAKAEAAYTLARWLIGDRKAHEAARVIETAKSGLDSGTAVELEGRWQALLDQTSLALKPEEDAMEEEA